MYLEVENIAVLPGKKVDEISPNETHRWDRITQFLQ